MKSAFLVTESCRHGYSVLVAQVGEWVVEHLDFNEEPMQAPREVYSMLGAEGTWLDSFVDLELQWRSSRLLAIGRQRACSMQS